MLVIKDLYSDISDCVWLFYGSKYKIDRLDMLSETELHGKMLFIIMR